MNYYTQTIPPTLAEKLKEKGMPMEVWNGTIQGMPYISVMEKSSYDWLDKELGNTPSKVEVRYSIPPYGACFDWLLEKEFVITIRADFSLNGEIAGWIPHFNHWGMKRCPTWHEAADAAIEKALTLI